MRISFVLRAHLLKSMFLDFCRRLILIKRPIYGPEELTLRTIFLDVIREVELHLWMFGYDSIVLRLEFHFRIVLQRQSVCLLVGQVLFQKFLPSFYLE